MKIAVMSKKELIAVGFSDYQASEIIRQCKVRLSNAGLNWYKNPRLGMVPVSEVKALLGVSEGDEVQYSDIKTEIQSELTTLEDLLSAKDHFPKSQAKSLIRMAQENMVAEGSTFYKNARHWIVPTRAINKLIYRKVKN